jgi:hypothetical protein
LFFIEQVNCIINSSLGSFLKVYLEGGLLDPVWKKEIASPVELLLPLPEPIFQKYCVAPIPGHEGPFNELVSYEALALKLKPYLPGVEEVVAVGITPKIK